jgi:HEAT repeat protein
MLRYGFLIILSFGVVHRPALAQKPADPVAAEIQKLVHGDVVDRAHAAKALGTHGASAAAGVPALIRALRDPDSIVVGETVNALRKIGEPALPALVQALQGQDVKLRHQAAVALSRIAPTDPVAVKALIKALKDSSADVRRRAALALENAGKVGNPCVGVVVGLIGALTDRDGTVRMSAAVTLGNIGADAREAAGPLSDLLKDDDARLRAAAADALRKINAVKSKDKP